MFPEEGSKAGLEYMFYKERLKTVELPSLGERRLRCDFFSPYNCSWSPDGEGRCKFLLLTIKHTKLLKGKFQLDVRKHLIIARMVKHRNRFPSGVVDAHDYQC